jgi:hypothetical protein
MMILMIVIFFIIVIKAVACGDAITIFTEFAVTFHSRPISHRTTIMEGDAVVGRIAVAAHFKGEMNIMARIYTGLHIARIDIPVHIMGGSAVVTGIAVALH